MLWFCVLFVFVTCLVFPMLPMSLGCPFLLAPSIFSSVYFQDILDKVILSSQTINHVAKRYHWVMLWTDGLNAIKER